MYLSSFLSIHLFLFLLFIMWTFCLSPTSGFPVTFASLWSATVMQNHIFVLICNIFPYSQGLYVIDLLFRLGLVCRLTLIGNLCRPLCCLRTDSEDQLAAVEVRKVGSSCQKSNLISWRQLKFWVYQGCWLWKKTIPMMITYQLIRSLKGGWRASIYPKDLSILKTLIGGVYVWNNIVISSHEL